MTELLALAGTGAVCLFFAKLANDWWKEQGGGWRALRETAALALGLAGAGAYLVWAVVLLTQGASWLPPRTPGLAAYLLGFVAWVGPVYLILFASIRATDRRAASEQEVKRGD